MAVTCLYFPYLFPRSQREDDSGDQPDNVVVCEAMDSFTCSVALTADTHFFSLVISSNSAAVARPVQLRVPGKNK